MISSPLPSSPFDFFAPRLFRRPRPSAAAPAVSLSFRGSLYFYSSCNFGGAGEGGRGGERCGRWRGGRMDGDSIPPLTLHTLEVY